LITLMPLLLMRLGGQGNEDYKIKTHADY
jgi:hypothetical protein